MCEGCATTAPPPLLSLNSATPKGYSKLSPLRTQPRVLDCFRRTTPKNDSHRTRLFRVPSSGCVSLVSSRCPTRKPNNSTKLLLNRPISRPYLRAAGERLQKL